MASLNESQRYTPGENEFAKLYYEQGNIPILEYKTNNPYLMGKGAAELMAPQIARLFQGYIKPFIQILNAAPPSCYKGSEYDESKLSGISHLWTEYVKPLLVYKLNICKNRALDHLNERAERLTFPEEYLQEMKGLADGLREYRESQAVKDKSMGDPLTFADLLAGHVFLDSYKKLGMAGQSAAFGCSAIAIKTDAGTILGRNLDWPDLPHESDLRIGEFTLVTKRLPPEGGYQVASIGFPGMIGDLSGINEKGLTLVICESGRSISQTGIPYNMLMRRVLERSASIDEVREILNQTQCASSVNVTVSDALEVATFQIDPQSDRALTEIAPYKGMVISTNHFVDAETASVIKRSIADESSLARYEYIRNSAQSEIEEGGSVDQAVKEALHMACESDTIQAMVIEPQTQTVQLHFAKEWSALKFTAKYVQFNPFVQKFF